MLWLRPILVIQDGTIFAGNMRYRAAQHLGWPELPVSHVDIPEQQARSDHSGTTPSGETGWRTTLQRCWSSSERTAPTLSCWASATGIYGNSSTDWTAKDGLADPDDIPELPEEPITKTGDLWLLGLHGRQPPAVEGEQARDPDEGRDSYKDPESAVGSRSTSSRQPPAPRRAGPDLSMACVDAAVTGGRGVVKDRTARPQVIIWVKTRGVLTALAFMWQHEPCMYGWKQGKMLNLKPPANETTVWHVDQKGEQDGIRPTADALPHEEGGICFEPFSGSRTYIIAAELTERAATLSTRSLLILMSRSRAGNR